MIGQTLPADAAMALAIAEAEKGLATVGTNPAVGCVILDADYRLLSTGYHKISGEAHAEIDALNNLLPGTDLTGAHVFVTLEPCAFEGRTGACAKKLAELPLASVTIGLQDPHPKVNGEGVRILEAAGIKTSFFEGYQPELRRLIEVFAYGISQKKAFVSLKVATSLDGQMALQSGESQWITSEKAREHTHEMRSQHDAILIGVNTFLTDNPTLNIRHGRHKGKQLKVILLDPQGRAGEFLASSQILKAHGRENIFVVTSQREKLPEGVSIIEVKEGQEIDLHQLKADLYERGIYSVFVEGGAATHSAFLNQKAAERIYQYIAPSLIGAAGGLAWTSQVQVEKMSEKIELSEVVVKELTPDILVTGRL